MNEKAKLAFELANTLIQRKEVTPINNPHPSSDPSPEHKILFILEDEAGSTIYSFHELVAYFLDNIERYNEW